MLLTILFLSCTTQVHTRAVYNDDAIVYTPLGAIRGIEESFNDVKIRAFLGVPYAKVPTGNKRFALPEMVERWDGELIARRPATTCYYTIDTMFPQFPGAEMWNPPNELGEDCLGLNIWAPENHDGTVMVWIYGGGFFSGSPSLDLYDGRALSVHEKAIVVNINYRLGAFGYLYFGAGTPVPGNMGLMDQQLALKWVYENIRYFGGDPDKITLFGESAGGASATAHLFAPGSERYFSKVIAKSGAIINNWATKPKEIMRQMSTMLARRLNCTNPLPHVDPLTDPYAVVECLSKIPASTVQKEADAVSTSLALPMTFAFVPVDEDDNFFQGNLFEKLRQRSFKKDVSLLVGTVKDEGTYWLPYYLYKYGFNFNHTISSEDRHNRALISEVQYANSFNAFLPYFGGSPLVKHALMHAYSGVSESTDVTERYRDGVARFVGDYFFTCSLIDFADIVADEVYGAVYMYYFTRRSSANPWPKWMGVMHGYEIEYVFGMPLRLPHQYNPKELQLERTFSDKVMHLWGQFAKTG
ncbi:acetylcholinesterase [Aphelenchoides avenae]|nr:acetylcholinesterase [Aphelenchus avenae]